MAQLVIAAAGAALGAATLGTAPVLFGLGGGALGWMGGSILGSMLVGGQKGAGPRLEDLRVTGTEYGGGIPWCAGAPRVAGDLIWASDRREIAKTEDVGKGGGSEYTSYTYEIDALYLLADQQSAIVTRCWDNGKLIWTNLASADDGSRVASEQTEKWRRITVYGGGDAQMPDPTYEAAVTNAPGYTRRLTVLIEGLQLGSSGALPNLTFEVVTNGDSSADFVQRHVNTATGVAFNNTSNTGVGAPGIVSMVPNVRVAVQHNTNAIVYQFSLAGARLTDSTRTVEEPFPGPPGWPGDVFLANPTNFPVGIAGGLPVRVSSHSSAIGSSAYPQIPAGWQNALGWGVGLVKDLALLLPAGRYIGDTIPCSDGRHLLVYTAPSNATGGAAVLNRWHLIYVDGFDSYLVRSGDIAVARSIAAYGSCCSYNYTTQAAMLEDDLQHVWMANSASTRQVSMFKIEADGVLRQRSYTDFALPSGAASGLLSVWAEGSYMVCVSQATYTAFRRKGDTIESVTVQDVVEALCDRATMPAGTYDAAALASITQPVRALSVSNGSARQALEILRSSHGFDAYVTDKLYFVPRGGAPVVTIDADDLGAGEGDASDQPFAPTINADLEIPSQVAVAYRNMDADQITGTELSDRGPTTQDSIQTVQLAIGMKPAEARGVADAIVRDAYAGRITASVSLPMGYTNVTPTDVVQVPDADGTLYRMRVTRRQDAGGIMTLDLVGDDGAVVIEEVPTDDNSVGQTAVVAVADTTFYPLDIPLLRDADDAPGYYVAARGSTANWPGAAVFSSTNGTDFVSVASVAESAVLGTCTTTLGNWSGTAVMDEINSVTVDVAHGELSSVTRDALLLDASLNALLVGSEVIQFATASLQSSAPNVYKLTRLLRGRRGTEWAGTGHVASERAVLLRTRGLRRVAQQATDVAQARQLKGVTLGAMVSSVSPVAFTNTGVSAMPPAPVDLRASPDGAGNAVLTWKRRSRLAATFCGAAGISVPLGETSERYDVEIWNSTYTTRKRLFAGISGSAVSYSYAQQVADWAAAQTTLYVRVYQLNSAGARGYALQASVGVAVDAAATLNPQLIAASASGWIAWSTRNESSGVPGVVNDLIVLSLWKATSPAGPYSLVREVTTATSAPGGSPALPAALGRTVQLGSFALQVQYAVGGSTAPKWVRTPLDASSAPLVLTPSIAFTAPRILVADGSRVLLLGEGNRVYSSTDGQAWTLLGSMSGATFPYPIGGEPFVTHTVTKIGSRYFLAFGVGGDIATTGPLFYSDDADACAGWTAASGISVNGVTQAMHGEIAYDGAKHYAATVDYTAGTTTVYASTDGGATWSAEYTTALGTGFEVNTAGTTAAWIWQFHVTGTTGSDKVRLYTYNGVTYEKTVGTTTWTAKASGLINPGFGVVYGGAMAMTDNGAKYTLDGSRVRAETAGVFAAATGF